MELFTEQEQKYKDYLKQHISGVQKSYYDILRPYLVNQTHLPEHYIKYIDNKINTHDATKYSEEEWKPYVDHFYPKNGVATNQKEYDLAWLHHQKFNDHHWQYWVLIKDSPKGGEEKVQALPMSYAAICEMLCDWSSFQYYRPGSTANQWYLENHNNMILNPDTIETIERVLRNLPNL